MLIIPYSTALTLARPPVVTYAMVLVCILVFFLQLTSGITQDLIYHPTTWNPLKMVSSSLAHADFAHIFGNMVFYLAFAPALELLIGSKIRYLWIMLFITIPVTIVMNNMIQR